MFREVPDLRRWIIVRGRGIKSNRETRRTTKNLYGSSEDEVPETWVIVGTDIMRRRYVNGSTLEGIK